MKLIDMHHQPGEGECAPCMPCPAGNEYPYGLRITLHEEQLKALGIDGLPPAGTCLHLEACAVITRSATEDPDADGDIDFVCLELQMTQLGVEVDGEISEDEDEDDPLKDRQAVGERLYAKDGKRE
jgi:hypothetical protein